MDKKCLVTYFSATGTTKKVAKTLAEAANADLYEIEATIPYSDADLDWNDKNSRCTNEWKDKSIRPEITMPVSDMGQYDVIFVGYPIWWENAPNIILTFLESYDFSDKIVVPFSTSGGSVRGSQGMNLYRYCSKQADWKPGKLLNKYQSKEVMSDWIKDLGLMDAERSNI